MRAVIQRVNRASVRVAGETVGQINRGLCVLVGVGTTDTAKDADQLAEKITHLRIFEDESGKMNRSVQDVGGAVLLVSQFTLLGDCRKGRRPGFSEAMEPEGARSLFERCVAAVRGFGLPVETGRFRADMEVELVNDGPVTLLLDTRSPVS